MWSCLAGGSPGERAALDVAAAGVELTTASVVHAFPAYGEVLETPLRALANGSAVSRAARTITTEVGR